ncbi:hypothetical protein KFK09_000962 [Dendrobium nobile]|uniref:Uncharacterized protein n=1 Tax=Dendrobium nobile TaxID=94219 RepID=A0A8T3CA15_DENNO|nr:hypothetical protein KFK09_000962 [Dendrobium nobile]
MRHITSYLVLSSVLNSTEYSVLHSTKLNTARYYEAQTSGHLEEYTVLLRRHPRKILSFSPKISTYLVWFYLYFLSLRYKLVLPFLLHPIPSVLFTYTFPYLALSHHLLSLNGVDLGNCRNRGEISSSSSTGKVHCL